MNFTKYLNPYYYIGAAIVLATIFGGFFYQSRMIHHYHTLYDGSQQTVATLTEQIREMTTAQKSQTAASDRTVLKVVQGPETVKTLIKTIHDTPISSDCSTPKYPQEVLNAF